jgi:hypothetical protein
MSLITKNNYEAYLLDYVEGHLSASLIAELVLFFEKNPQFKEDLEAFEIYELLPPEVELSDKSPLKKEEELIHFANYEDFFIAEMEGLNSPEVSEEVHSFLAANPNIKKEFNTYQKAQLLAPEIIFEDKKTLLKKETKVFPLYWWASSAAAAILIVFWFNGFNGTSERQYSPLAGTNAVSWDEEEKEDALNFYVHADEKPQIAVAAHKEVEKPVKKQKVRLNKSNLPNPELKEDPSLAVMPLHNKDTAELKEAHPKENTVEEGVLFAENSVKIIYEDEPLTTALPRSEQKKITKLGVIRKALKQQLKEKVLDKGKGGVLLAVNAKPFNFIRGRNKKKGQL